VEICAPKETKIEVNKSTKIRLNYLLGIVISLVVVWRIYEQVGMRLNDFDKENLWHTGPQWLFWLALLLIPVNIGLEAFRWKLLAGSAERLTYCQSLASCLVGYAFSVITPNRIGEYPGRILYLKRKNTIRLIGVSVLGACAQLFAVLFFGFAGLVFYNIQFPSAEALWVLLGLFMLTTGIAFCYWNLEKWMPRLGHLKWFQKFSLYRRLLKRFSRKKHLVILLLSLLRYMVYAGQLLILLCWMRVCLPLAAGFFMAALFFCAMAIIPSVAFAELGIRGQVGLFLFGIYSSNTLGILGATMLLWCANLMLPAAAGSLLLLRMRFLR
jgi:hypothetical protein